mgnify:CR=1 FL=1
MRIIDHLIRAIRHVASVNPETQATPCCILWPDGERQWESAIERIRLEIPELFIFGSYDTEAHRGPAIWLRCVVARNLQDVQIPDDGRPPVLYLPGVSRQDLRDVEHCPEHLKPIAPLQYSGAVWSQENGRDWTVLAYLKSRAGGLGLDVAQDAATRLAIERALAVLLEEDVSALQGRRLEKDDFNRLIAGDPDKDLLKWIDDSETFRQTRSAEVWDTFVEVCRDTFGFDPATDGVLVGASRLAAHKGRWQKTWDRFC